MLACRRGSWNPKFSCYFMSRLDIHHAIQMIQTLGHDGSGQGRLLQQTWKKLRWGKAIVAAWVATRRLVRCTETQQRLHSICVHGECVSVCFIHGCYRDDLKWTQLPTGKKKQTFFVKLLVVPKFNRVNVWVTPCEKDKMSLFSSTKATLHGPLVSSDTLLTMWRKEELPTDQKASKEAD